MQRKEDRMTAVDIWASRELVASDEKLAEFKELFEL